MFVLLALLLVCQQVLVIRGFLIYRYPYDQEIIGFFPDFHNETYNQSIAYEYATRIAYPYYQIYTGHAMYSISTVKVMADTTVNILLNESFYMNGSHRVVQLISYLNEEQTLLLGKYLSPFNIIHVDSNIAREDVQGYPPKRMFCKTYHKPEKKLRDFLTTFDWQKIGFVSIYERYFDKHRYESIVTELTKMKPEVCFTSYYFSSNDFPSMTKTFEALTNDTSQNVVYLSFDVHVTVPSMVNFFKTAYFYGLQNKTLILDFYGQVTILYSYLANSPSEDFFKKMFFMPLNDYFLFNWNGLTRATYYINNFYEHLYFESFIHIENLDINQKFSKICDFRRADFYYQPVVGPNKVMVPAPFVLSMYQPIWLATQPVSKCPKKPCNPGASPVIELTNTTINETTTYSNQWKCTKCRENYFKVTNSSDDCLKCNTSLISNPSRTACSTENKDGAFVERYMKSKVVVIIIPCTISLIFIFIFMISSIGTTPESHE